MSIALYVSVPVACFRVPRAREYFETFPCPPPSTVYGMLLSMLGEVDRREHEGAEIAIALLSEPKYSVVLRTMWRVKDRHKGPGLGNNRRPDFQELLSDVALAVWIRQGNGETRAPSLADRVNQALDQPASIARFGGLSLGESTHLVNDVTRLRSVDEVQLLIADEEGDLSLPVWPDHVGSKTRWQQYRLIEFNPKSGLPDVAWTAITRPSGRIN
ncbi:MAG TPA: type I-MYXAN CRISPR-associated protein Cas5/Cmx5/DevS [Pyrinomonadaceae bacterium]|nr:type I-MYXAN CRISPR-associated protein Cas5/Cmx5/DevS [Pyrinomonadaceae bacterium]